MQSQPDMEHIMNLTYPGLKLLFRDANLRRVAHKYEVGMLLRQRDELDASLLGGGLLDTHRFAILSHEFVDVTQIDSEAKWARCVIAEESYFKVLDVYGKLGKTQITLLHLPQKYWQLFEDITTNVDELLIDYTRKRFDVCLNEAPLPELADPEWRKRCCHLIGMTDLGQITPLR